MPTETDRMNDRDLLIMIYTKQENVEKRLDSIETSLLHKADAKRLEDIEEDVKGLQKTQWLASGFVSAIATTISFIFTHMIK